MNVVITMPGVDRGVHEVIEVIVREGLAAPFADLPDAAVVAAEDEQHRRFGDPRHVGDERGDGLHFRAIRDVDDVGLLQVGFRRRRQRAGEQKPQQRRIDRIVRIFAVRAVLDDARELFQAGVGEAAGRRAEALAIAVSIRR